MHDKHTIARVIRDLNEIKAAVKRNSPVLREIVTARFFWWLFLIFGVAVVGFSLLMHFLVLHYGGYASIPLSLRLTFWIVASIAGIVMYAFRIRGVIRTLKKIDSRLTLLSILGDHNLGEFFHIYGPVAVIAAGLSVYFSRTGQGIYIIAVWGGCIGLVLNLIAFAVHLPEFYVAGYWCLVSAAVSIFVPGVSASLWTAICIGGGCIVYAVVSELMRWGTSKGGDE
jgi:hypothetical protein